MSKQLDTYDTTGTVKWFEKTKGYGFVVCDASGDDILLHANVLREFGQKTLLSGSTVRMLVSMTPQGKQALDIYEITPPPRTKSKDPENVKDSAIAPFKPVRVKWYDDSRGFGFVELYGTADEAFLHAETLSKAGLTTVDDGEALNAQIGTGDRGLVVIALNKWAHTSD